jgi:hypothetical protein
MFALMFPVMPSMTLLAQNVAHSGTASTAKNKEGARGGESKSLPGAVFVVSL